MPQHEEMRAEAPPLARLRAALRREAAGMRLVRTVFLRGLALIYLIAFASLGVQVLGLVGSRGILPVGDYLAAFHADAGSQAYWRMPSLVWFAHGDGFLVGACWAGVALAALLLADVAPALCLAALWVLYQTVCFAGQTFLNYQWDTLLLETGLMAIFLAPWRLAPGWLRRGAGARDRQPIKTVSGEIPAGNPAQKGGANEKPSGDPAPHWVPVWMLRLLLARLMFSSGLVKLASGDPHWRDLTALTYHYWTQPLPTWLGWWAWQLPLGIQQASCFAMFFIELMAPLCVFGLRRVRIFGASAIALLMVAISLTGNFAFYDFIALALCVLWLDDAAVRRALGWAHRRRRPAAPDPAPARRLGQIQRGATWGMAAVMLPMGVLMLWLASGGRWVRVPVVGAVEEFVYRARMTSNYGAFAAMTTDRPVIILEGSDDAKSWREIPLRWQTDDVARRPPFVAPHQPRLDWEFWFASLGGRERVAIVERLMARVLEGDRVVTALMADSEYTRRPPKYVRAVMWDYLMTTWSERRRTGDWWKRRNMRVVIPAVELAGLKEEKSNAK